MFHCNSSVVTTARLETATTLLEGSAAPGILTAKALQSVLLSARQRNRNDEVKPSDEIVSPYGRMPRQDRVRRYRNRPNDSNHLHTNSRLSHDVIARRKRCRKLDPMPALMFQTPTDKPTSNQTGGGDAELEVPDKLHIEQLRSGLNQKSSKQQQDAERLQREIQWIHGHFPVLKLANSKCSLSLRQQLFRTAILHVLTNFMLRKALLTWYQKLLDAQRKERLQLSASRQLVAMFRKLSLERAADRFNAWKQWVFDSQAQENMAAAITLQRFSKFLRCRREEREAAEQQAALVQALDKLHRSATTIQRVYRKYRQHLQHCRDEIAVRQIQRIAKRRRDYNDFIKRTNAATLLQRNYRGHIKQCYRKRARAIAQLLDRSREQKARCIQTAWRGYKKWRDNVLAEIVRKLVDQVEFLDAVLAIQRHLRGFQCRFRIKKKSTSALRIQKCWRAGRRRETSRVERRMMVLQRNLAASCLQRAFRRQKEERKVRGVLRKSTRPLYLRAQHLSASFREQFRLPIAKSATVVIQTNWRHHCAYEKEKQRRITAGETIRGFLKHGVATTKWRITVVNLRHRRHAAACTLQHRIRHLHQLHSRSTHRRPSVVNVLEQISATTKIQLWYRRRRCDLWRFLLDRLLAEELPRCIKSVNRIARCWKDYSARKQEQVARTSALADLIERQRQSESENCAARIIQRMFKRKDDKRKGQVLLHKYRILLRQDMKRRQQRVIVHKYLEEKSQQRKKKQESQAATLATRQQISINSMESSQVLSLDTYTSEASAFSLDENPNINGVLTADSPVQYWSGEYQRAYLYDPVTGVSTWL